MTLPTPSPTVVFQALEDGAVLFAPESETYFGLNAVGTLVWQHLPPVLLTRDSLCRAIAARFPEVPIGTIEADVEELLESLTREGLVQATAAGGADDPPAA